MDTYKKIQKYKHVTYYYTQNKVNSANAVIIADLHKVPKAVEQLDNYYEAIVAWVNLKSKKIEWNDETEAFIDKDIIRRYIVLDR